MRIGLSLALLCGLTAVATAQEKETPHPYDVARKAIDALIVTDQKNAAGNADVLVDGPVVSDRKAQTVTIHALGTTLSKSEPCEFFLTTAGSGKDYESLTLTFATPAQVLKGLQFIGLKEGKPVDYEINRFWPRGPRVVTTIAFDENGKTVTLPAGEMLIDSATGKPSSIKTFLFTGSSKPKREANLDAPAGDAADTRTVLANYNDPAAILDVPMRALQSMVYGSFHSSDTHTLSPGQLVTITIAPAPPELARTVTEAQIVLKNNAGIEVSLVNPSNSAPIIAPANGQAFLNALADKIKTDKLDLFASVSIDPSLRVTDIRDFVAPLQEMESDDGLRVDPSGPGELFHRAFFPDEKWRNRDDRLGEPFELHLKRDNGKLVGQLVRLIDNPKKDDGPEKILQTFDASTPEICMKSLTDNASQWSRVIFIYPPADLTYGELMTYARPAMEAYPRIFVFRPEGAATTQSSK